MRIRDAVLHQCCDLLRIVGLRSRLRCPNCHKIGTFKPHGAWLDFFDERGVRRWLCKWCGYYRGPEGQMWARVSRNKKWWLLPDDPDWEGGTTPRDIMLEWEVDPWRG